MKISEAKKRAAFTVRLDLGKYNDELSGEYVTLKEPSYADMAALQAAGDDDRAQVEWFSSAMPALVVDSSFTYENDKPAAPKDVAEIVLESADLATSLIKDWTEACPFFSRNKKSAESETAPLSTSEAEIPDKTGK